MIGETLSHYEIRELLGKGGMGEVYLARDTQLDRDVALKLLPADFTADPERVARFRREARVLAALNHPNIATIHGLGEVDGRLFLAMELAPGQTLAERLAAGALPVEEALAIAGRIARGLEEAHAKGIVHRDLKPANIKLGPDGEVKILDFGLARAYESAEADESADGATVTMDATVTRAGVVMGTAGYMSPEQARGKHVDSRTDVWAFGVILWEMLGGRRLFQGETYSDTIAQVLRGDPQSEALPDGLPASLNRLVRRCLQRDRGGRLHHIADARIVLEEILRDGTSAHEIATTGGNPAARGGRRAAWSGWLVAAVLAVGAVFLGWRDWQREPIRTAGATRFDLALPDSTWISYERQAVAVSPDGRTVVAALQTAQGGGLYRRDLAASAITPIAGTEYGSTPFFSPDGRWIAFTQDNRLRKVPLDGGSPVDLCATEWGGGVWTTDGRIIITRSYAGGLDVVSAAGGEATTLTEPDIERGELGHWWPQLLPDEKWLIYTSWSTPIDKARVMAYSLATGEHRELVAGGAFGRWSPTGHLLWVREGKLLAALFDRDRMIVTGEAEPVLEDVYFNGSDGYTNLAFSAGGNLVYATRSVMEAPRELVWVDRTGAIIGQAAPARLYQLPRLSPDGRRIAIPVSENGNTDVWLQDLQRGVRSRFTFSPSSDFNPVWTPDGRTIIYNGEEPQFTIYRRPADGSTEPELLLREPIDTLPTSVSPDGELLVATYADTETDSDIWIVPLGDVAAARPLVRTRFSESQGVVSPDGRWLAYTSNESGRQQVYALAFPDGGSRIQVSVEGGDEPCWSPRGDELFFRSREGVMTVPVDLAGSVGGELAVGQPRVLFNGPFEPYWAGASYSVAADAQRFLMVHAPLETMPRRIRVVVDWFDELQSRSAAP